MSRFFLKFNSIFSLFLSLLYDIGWSDQNLSKICWKIKHNIIITFVEFHLAYLTLSRIIFEYTTRLILREFKRVQIQVRFQNGFTPMVVKTGRLKRSQISILFLSIKNLRRRFDLFTYISIDYLVHEITKEFWKNSHFENMRTGFLQRCQKSLRCKISLICLKYWIIEAKVGFRICHCPKNCSEYHLDTI